MSYQPADLFAELWVELDRHEAEVLDLAQPSPAERDGGKPLLEACLASRPVNFDQLRAWFGTDLKRMVVTAQAIDSWYAPLSDPNLTVSGMDPALAEARADYITKSRLDGGGASGQVVLRRPLWGRWSLPHHIAPDAEGVGGFFEHLLVLPDDVSATHPDDPAQLIRRKVSFALSATRDCRPLPVDMPWLVGLAPLAQDASDIDVEVTSADGSEWYDAKATDLSARVETIVRELCAAGCHVIAFPEMVFNPVSQAALKKAIRKHGPGSRLCLVLGGTTRTPSTSPAGMPANRCIVFDHVGRSILEQDKMSRWNLSRSLCDRYGLATLVGPQVKEFMEPGTEVRILERHGLGRLGILICEDLGRSEPGKWLRRHLLLDLQFTPVMDGDLSGERWEKKAGGQSCFDGGFKVIVVNSLPFTHRQNAANSAQGKHGRVVDRCGIGLLFDWNGAQARHRLCTAPLVGPDPVSVREEWATDTWDELSSVDIS